MKKWIIGVFIIVILAGGAYVMFGGGALGLPGTAAKPTPTVEPVARADKAISVDGKVVPFKSAGLSVTTPGIVAKLPVAEGDRVTAGQVLLQQENAKQRVALTQAETGLKRAQAVLAQVKAGARSEEVAAARAGVDLARARLTRLQEGARADEIAAAEATLAAAQANLKAVLDGPDETQITAARADLSNAEAALKQAQADYDKIAYTNDASARPEALRLEQATNNYRAAKSRLDILLQQPREASVSTARSQVQQAQAALDRVKAGASASDVAGAEAEVRRANAQLQLVQAGARQEAIAVAEADVATAQAAIDQAKVALADTELKAPFDGLVASVEVAVGELVAPGTPVVRLADFAGWQVETTDLTELDVVRVRPGDKATLTFDAVPDLTLSGKVAKIKQMGVTRQGDITYTVTINPDKQAEQLRWNMTASVKIEPSK
ncbi:MAG: HlyD family secretion protein [Chloroflexota bacterium]